MTYTSRTEENNTAAGSQLRELRKQSSGISGPGSFWRNDPSVARARRRAFCPKISWRSREYLRFASIAGPRVRRTRHQQSPVTCTTRDKGTNIDTHMSQSDFAQRPVFCVYGDPLHRVQGRICPVNDLSEAHFSAHPLKRTYDFTFPKMVYFPSRWGCLAYVTKNWDLLESGPALAIATIPRLLNCQKG